MDPRERLAELAERRTVSLAALSRMIGRNSSYLQQYITKGSPRKLEEEDRRRLADFFAVSESELAAIATVSGEIYVGTESAEVLRLGASGNLEPLSGFAAVPGRETWYAGTALIDGKLLGPPLGIRSMAATCDE